MTATHRTPEEVETMFANFRARLLQEVWAAGWTATWERRAEALEAARPRPGDYLGQATREQLRARHDRLTAQAQACRSRATGADGSAIEALTTTLTGLTAARDHRDAQLAAGYAHAAAGWQETA